MTLRLSFSALKGQFQKGVAAMQRPIAEAATGAIREAADIAKVEGRASIAAAGFGRKWQNALRADAFPKKGKVSMRPAALVHHKIPYAGVFENGATISGKPKLWLPISGNLPVARRGAKMTPKRYIAEIGPLQSIKVPGKKPLLVAKADRGKRGKAKVTLAALRRGARGQGNVGSVPLFVGIDAVSIGRKFGVIAAVRRVVGRLGELYLKHLRT